MTRIAIVGATGAVGTIMRRLARERFPDAELVALASERSAGRELDDGLVVRALGENSINIEMISTSPIRISCVVPGDRVPDAVRALHSAFELSGEDTIRPEEPFGPFGS